MAVLPFQPTPFFANKNRAFWVLQLAGWGGAFLLRATAAIANQQPTSLLLQHLISVITGFSITLVLSVIFRELINRRPIVTWGVTGVVLMLSVGLYTFIDAWVLQLIRADSATSFTQLVIGLFYLPLTLLGAWSALYYAINFFLQVEQQADQLERLEAQATTAQLQMLRYQLNPHFLFNTLNSISTLVLLKQTEPANAMLTRLSSFLRHTLLIEPSGKVTLAQEVETLNLYLGIERMRFEDRLRTEFDIEPAAAKAYLPAMLLQPLVENAIKYAVSPQEEGAKISLSAQLVGKRLRISVSDTGPGLQGGDSARKLPDALTGEGHAVSTGVGLPNIRDRLVQAYGEDHSFEIRTPPAGGFTVIIELPHERHDLEEEPETPELLHDSPPKLAAPAQDTPTPEPALAPRQIGTQT
ncbi:sensor histidine kinase [Pontixanthobacter aquaemixtae]|uniref:Sensor histidine kinase n=1 Tax=Pontixanthobacter aquaemixtae TaxID=1958940 RepID=A0A844ZU44_9SPHN|nr:histidine kinase [Pontixanthobacter aquaemixtae]MXO91483.1 sensor histidine kinase [Pontixanthobacter aquaemixtae]